MPKWEMKIKRGYDPKTQGKIGLMASQLDDQLKTLKKELAGMTVEQLEWQAAPGMNTVGILLAHLASAEVYWFRIAPQAISWNPEGLKIVQKVCGFEDDGIPLPPEGTHPACLKGFTLEQYWKILDRARRLSHKVLKSWKDRDLDKLYRIGKLQASYSATIYHVLEHFCSHAGQILLIRHQMRNPGVLAPKAKKG
jgi:uncharacterized damage-inducible protein DinB